MLSYPLRETHLLFTSCGYLDISIPPLGKCASLPETKCVELTEVLQLESWAVAKVQLFGTWARYEVETSRHNTWKAFYSLLPRGGSKGYILF